MTASPPPRPRAPELSIIAPVFNEAMSIAPFFARLERALEGQVEDWEAIFVDDGSLDATLETLRALCRSDARARAISLSRNFGKEIAIAAGLDAARGHAAVIIDADLQHPPETIARFLDLWRQGYKNVYGVRSDRDGDSVARAWLTKKFYAAFQAFGETPLPAGAGDFRLLDRQAIDALRAMPEQARFSKGLYAWIGFRAIGVPYRVEARAHGQSKFSYRKLTRFAFDGFASFSNVPLKAWTILGFFFSFVAFWFALYFLIETAAFGVSMPGYASIIISVMFFSGVQLLSLGILGEYVSRIFTEVKRRPLYLVAETIEPSPETGPAREIGSAPARALRPPEVSP